MKITTTAAAAVPAATSGSVPHLTAVSPAAAGTGDILTISDEARSRIGALEAGQASLEQAVRESRQQARQGAREKIGMAHEYLKLLQRMSSPGDPAAAREAARMANEIRGAATAYQGALTRDEAVELAKETAAMVTEGGKALAIAKQLVQQYLRHKRQPTGADKALDETVDDAGTALRGLVNDGVAAGMQRLNTENRQA